MSVEYKLFFKYNLILTLLIFSAFLWHYQHYSVASLLLTLFGALSSAAILYLLFYLTLLPFAWHKRWVIALSFVLFVLTDIALIMDFFIYRLFHFHINAMVLNILTSPDAADSIQTGLMPVVLFVLFIGILIWIELALLKKIATQNTIEKNRKNKTLNRWLLLPLFLIILGEKISFGMASLYSQNRYIIPFKVIPLYQPLTFNKLAAKYFGFSAEKQAHFSIKTTSDLHYPLTPLVIDKKKKSFNIFIIASDSVKYDILSKENTPNLFQFSQEALHFKHHYSGGNSTRFGIFSLIYGLNATYWFSFLNSNQKPLLFDVLKQRDFHINIISSTNTNWPEFRKTCYVDIQQTIKDDFEGFSWQKDRQSTDYFIKQLSQKTAQKNRFTFIFLDAPHGYSFPPDYNRYHAPNEAVNYLAITKESHALEVAKKRYKNAVYYNDALFGEMIAALKVHHLYDDALILYTSDHGQEFYEQGNFGHNTSFANGQTHVPLLIKLPKSLQGTIPSKSTEMLTSHQDIVPTLLSLLGVTTPSLAYSNGYNLFSKTFKRDYSFCANWNNSAIITPYNVSIFSNQPNKLFGTEVREEPGYKKVNQTPPTRLLLDVMRENQKFLK